MKFAIGKPLPKPVEPPKLHLWLQQEGEDICLMAQNEHSEDYYLLTIYKDGNSAIHGGVDESLGLKLTPSHALAIKID
jgi:hypothetical protein